jgi:hypothetical protein
MRGLDEFGRLARRVRPLGPYLAALALMSSLIAWGFGTVVSTIAVNAAQVLLSGPRQTDATAVETQRLASLTLDQDTWSERARSRERWEPQTEPMVFPAYSREVEPDQQRRGGQEDTFRTVCVRLCDGFQWPVSFSTTRGHFGRDADMCESSCGAPARLFVQRHSAGSTEPLIDLTGQPYSRLPNADRFRTTYDASCKCTAHPWEEAAKNEHRVFALEAAVRKGDKQAAPALAETRKKVDDTRRKIAEQKMQANARLAAAGSVPPSGGTGYGVTAFASRGGGSKPTRTAAVPREDDGTMMRLGAGAMVETMPQMKKGYRGPLAYGGGWQGSVFQGN